MEWSDEPNQQKNSKFISRKFFIHLLEKNQYISVFRPSQNFRLMEFSVHFKMQIDVNLKKNKII